MILFMIGGGYLCPQAKATQEDLGHLARKGIRTLMFSKQTLGKGPNPVHTTHRPSVQSRPQVGNWKVHRDLGNSGCLHPVAVSEQLESGTRADWARGQHKPRLTESGEGVGEKAGNGGDLAYVKNLDLTAIVKIEHFSGTLDTVSSIK